MLRSAATAAHLGIQGPLLLRISPGTVTRASTNGSSHLRSPFTTEAMAEGNKKLTAQEAYDLMKSGRYRYLDVRTVEEFANGHVEGAVNIPIMFREPEGMIPNPDFEQQVHHFFPDLEKHLIVGCKAGSRSAKAFEMLHKEYTNLFDNAQGWDGWVAADLPVTK